MTFRRARLCGYPAPPKDLPPSTVPCIPFSCHDATMESIATDLRESAAAT